MLCDQAFAARDYATSADEFASVRKEMLAKTYGSNAQTEILNLIMLRAAVLAGSDRRQLASQLLDEHVSACHLAHKSNVIQRIQNDLVLGTMK